MKSVNPILSNGFISMNGGIVNPVLSVKCMGVNGELVTLFFLMFLDVNRRLNPCLPIVLQDVSGATGHKNSVWAVTNFAGASPAMVPSTAGAGASPCIPSCPWLPPWTCCRTAPFCRDPPSTSSLVYSTSNLRRPTIAASCPASLPHSQPAPNSALSVGGTTVCSLSDDWETTQGDHRGSLCCFLLDEIRHRWLMMD